MAFGRDMFNLRKQFTFYASYHNTRVNIAIHLLCIWPIFATLIMMLQYTPAFASTPSFLSGLPYFANAKLNAALLFSAIYLVCFTLMEPFVGTLASLLVLLIYTTTANAVAANAIVFGLPIWKAALAVHVTGWILQFIGHGVFEGRAPALLDSLDQALITAPLFVFLEVFFFFGYRRAFYESMMQKVESNIKAFRNRKKQK